MAITTSTGGYAMTESTLQPLFHNKETVPLPHLSAFCANEKKKGNNLLFSAKK
jgi:hypothetical protein